MLSRLRAAVERRPDHVFLWHEDRRVTYGELDALSDRLANALLAQGIAKGDRVTLGMGNSIEYVLAAAGVLKAGAVLNAVNPKLGTSALEYIMGHAGPRLVISDAENADALRPIAKGLAEPAPIGLFGAGGDALDLSALLDAAPGGAPDVEIGPEDFSTLMYTSGTTGDPKGVLTQHGAWERSAAPYAELLGVGEDDVVLAVTPLFHGNAWGAVMTALHAQATVVFPRTFSGSAFWPLVHETGTTALFTLGTILAMLLTREPSELERTSKLRIVMGIGSAPVRQACIERFGVTDVADSYGATDSGCVTLTPPGEPPREGAAGKPVPNVRVQIHDDEGNALPPGEVGEIAVAAPPPRSIYFNNPEATEAAYRGEWFLTGDLGRLDEDGWLYFVDRKADFIRHRSENVSSAWVEKVLREHPGVLEAAVIGIPHEIVGQEIMAFIVPDGEVDLDDLRRFAAERLARFEVPQHWELRDSLPKTPTERVQKYRLREEVGALGKKLLG